MLQCLQLLIQLYFINVIIYEFNYRQIYIFRIGHVLIMDPVVLMSISIMCSDQCSGYQRRKLRRIVIQRTYIPTKYDMSAQCSSFIRKTDFYLSEPLLCSIKKSLGAHSVPRRMKMIDPWHSLILLDGQKAVWGILNGHLQPLHPKVLIASTLRRIQ